MGQHRHSIMPLQLSFNYFVDGSAPLVLVTVYKQAREIHLEQKELRLSNRRAPIAINTKGRASAAALQIILMKGIVRGPASIEPPESKRKLS